VAWRNYEAARGTGGTFTLLFDDLTYKAQCLDLDGPALDRMREAWVAQLTWLFGEPPDVVATSSDFAAEHAEACAQLGIRQPWQRGAMRFTGDPAWEATPDTNPKVATATHPSLVVARVVDDALLHVEGFVRGKDLQGECGLYDYLTRRLGYRPIRQLYVPTVTRASYPTGRKESKSDGACSLFALREAGYTPWQIIETLEECNRRSRKAGLEQNVLPAGVLEPEAVSVLLSRVNEDLYRVAIDGVKGDPKRESDVREAVRRRTAEARERGFTPWSY
jgi:hypothetical protein